MGMKITVLAFIFVSILSCNTNSSLNMQNTQKATFAAGCFWGVESIFMAVEGVLSTEVGYCGGSTENPTYREVCTGNTGHAEAIHLTFDSSLVSYQELLKTFFKAHNPTELNRQGPDIGTQYRSEIFFHSLEQKEAAEEMIAQFNVEGFFGNPVVTQVSEASYFYRAEEYHQQYNLKNGKSCSIQ